MRRSIYLLVGWLLLGQFFAFAPLYAAARTVIKSASEYDYPPFCIVSPDGKADGFSVELLREALSAVDLEVEFKTGHWDALKKELSDGTIQVLPLVGRTPEREAVFDFTFPYVTLHGAVFVKKGDARIQQVSDLANKTVVVMKGDNAEEFARRTNIASHIVAVATYSEAMQLLDAGKCDAVIAQRLMGLALLKKIEIKNVVPLGLSLDAFQQNFCFAVRKGDKTLLSRLSEGLSIVITNGAYDRIQKKWFGPLFHEQISFKDVVKYVLPVLIFAIVVIALLSIFLLRIELIRKTRSLVEEIGERKRAEDVLSENQTRLDLALSGAEMGVWQWDMITNKRSFDDQACHLLGIDPLAFAGTPEEFLRVVHSDDREEIGAAMAQAIEQDKPYAPEYRAVWPDGSVHYITARGKLIRDDLNRPVRVNGIIWDITERKRMEEALRQSEENFRHSLDDSPLGVRIVTAAGETIYANRAILDMNGCDSIDELKATSPMKRYAPESFAEHQIRKEGRKRGDDGPSEYNISILGKDDIIRHLRVFRKEILWNC